MPLHLFGTPDDRLQASITKLTTQVCTTALASPGFDFQFIGHASVVKVNTL